MNTQTNNQATGSTYRVRKAVALRRLAREIPGWFPEAHRQLNQLVLEFTQEMSDDEVVELLAIVNRPQLTGERS